jgi:hypothetical protein
MMACYRNASVMMHGPLALIEAAQSAAHGRVGTAMEALGQRGVALSLWSLAASELPRMAVFSLGRRPSAQHGHE